MTSIGASQLGADNPLQRWRNRHESVTASVDGAGGVTGQVDVAAVQHPQTDQQLVVDIEPGEPVDMTALVRILDASAAQAAQAEAAAASA